jgi:hypothetical protein
LTADNADATTFSGTRTLIDAGYYLLRASLAMDGKTAGRREAVHIYQNLTTQAAYTFTDADFTAPLPPTITIYWEGDEIVDRNKDTIDWGIYDPINGTPKKAKAVLLNAPVGFDYLTWTFKPESPYEVHSADDGLRFGNINVPVKDSSEMFIVAVSGTTTAKIHVWNCDSAGNPGTVEAWFIVTPPPPSPYNTTKLSGSFLVVADPGTGTAGADSIFYNPGTKKLYAGTDEEYTLDETVDAALIADLAVFFGVNGLGPGDMVIGANGVFDTVFFVDPSTNAAKINALMASTADYFQIISAITLDDDLHIGRDKRVVAENLTLNGHTIYLALGAVLTFNGTLTLGTSGTDILAFSSIILKATGSATAFETTNNTSNLTTTAAPVKTIRGSYCQVTIQAGGTQEGEINAASTFKAAG